MSSFVKNFEPFSVRSKPLIVGVGYCVLVIALFAARISTQIMMLRSPLGTITKGSSHGVGSPVTSSMKPSISSRLSSSFTLSRKAKGICCPLWARDGTEGSI